MSQINLDALLRVDDPDALTEAQIAYLRVHPEILSLIGDRESLGTRHLWRILIAALALVALFLFLQKYIVGGLTAGSVK